MRPMKRPERIAETSIAPPSGSSQTPTVVAGTPWICSQNRETRNSPLFSAKNARMLSTDPAAKERSPNSDNGTSGSAARRSTMMKAVNRPTPRRRG